MRFYFDTIKPMVGSERTVIKFLFWPRKFNNELRWLEFSLLRQRYVIKMVHMPDCPNEYDIGEWKTTGWGD